jgi:hypothetical protein
MNKQQTRTQLPASSSPPPLLNPRLLANNSVDRRAWGWRRWSWGSVVDMGLPTVDLGVPPAVYLGAAAVHLGESAVAGLEVPAVALRAAVSAGEPGVAAVRGRPGFWGSRDRPGSHNSQSDGGVNPVPLMGPTRRRGSPINSLGRARRDPSTCVGSCLRS